MDSTRLCTRGNQGDTGHGLTALALAGCLLSVAAQAGCENRQVAVIFLKNRAPEATALGAYYKLNEPTYRSAGVRQNLDRFGIEAQLGTTGDLDVQVFSYANDIPCSLGSGNGTVRLPGEFRQNLNIDLSSSVSTCFGAKEPAGFPSQSMAVWAKAPNDIWLVGDGGKILRWNGDRYTTVPLPSSLASLPPDWTSVVGTSRGEILIAGTKGYVLRWTASSNTLEPLTVMPPAGVLIVGLNWRAMSVADPSVGDVWLAGSGGNVGYYNPGSGANVNAVGLSAYAGIGQPGTVISRDINGVSCVAATRPVGPLYDCWFVADQGTLLRYVPKQTMYNCASYAITPATTANLTGVWLGANATMDRFDLRVVGKGTTILRASTKLSDLIPYPFSGTSTPIAFDSYKQYLPASLASDFDAIGSGPDSFGSNSTTQVWVTGSNGTVLRWDDSAQSPGSTVPFTLINTRLQNRFERLSAMTNGVVTTGPGPVLFYAGTLFSPRT